VKNEWRMNDIANVGVKNVDCNISDEWR
jgi:hypothetical protein